MGTSGNRDCQWLSWSILKDFTEEALTISAGIYARVKLWLDNGGFSVLFSRIS